MRCAVLKFFGPVIVTSFLALAGAGGTLAEEADFEPVSTDGSQIVPVGEGGAKQQTKNLNTVPEDGMETAAPKGPDNRLIRQLVSARPNEDIVICVAGCFSGRDRVVYAQPFEPPAKAAANDQVATRQKISAAQATDGDASPSAMKHAAGATGMHSVDPQSPTILNGASDATASPSANGETN